MKKIKKKSLKGSKKLKKFMEEHKEKINAILEKLKIGEISQEEAVEQIAALGPPTGGNHPGSGTP